MRSSETHGDDGVFGLIRDKNYLSILQLYDGKHIDV
jgi:hypothetical protein